MVEELARLRVLILAFQASRITLNQFCLRSGVLVEEVDAACSPREETLLGNIWADLEIINATSLDDPSYEIAADHVAELVSRMEEQVEWLLRIQG